MRAQGPVAAQGAAGEKSPSLAAVLLTEVAIVHLLLVTAFVVWLEAYGPLDGGAVHRCWLWYNSTPADTNNGALSVIPSVAVVAWTGGLVAYTLDRRITADFANGMWMLVAAFVAPLLALIAQGAALRTIALFSAAFFGTVALLQIAMLLRVKLLLGGDIRGSRKVQRRAAALQDSRLQNVVLRFLSGWKLSGLFSIMSMGAVVSAGATVIAAESLILLVLGIFVVYEVIAASYAFGTPDEVFMTAMSPQAQAELLNRTAP